MNNIGLLQFGREKLLLFYFCIQLVAQRWISTCPIRRFTTTSVVSIEEKNVRAGVPKITQKGTRPLTYEEAQPPQNIGHTKAWNSWNTSKQYIIQLWPSQEVGINNCQPQMGCFPEGNIIVTQNVVKSDNTIVTPLLKQDMGCQRVTILLSRLC